MMNSVSESSQTNLSHTPSIFSDKIGNFNNIEDLCKTISQMFDTEKATLKYHNANPFGLENYNQIFSAIKTLPQKFSFRVEFYFGKNQGPTITITEDQMKIWLKAKANYQISHFLIQILTFASSANIKHLQIFTENEDYREFQEYFEKFEDFCRKNHLNDKKFEMRFGCFQIVNQSVYLMNRHKKMSFESFNEIWTILKKIPVCLIEKQNIIIKTENIEFLNILESIDNSRIPITYNFYVSPPESDSDKFCFYCEKILAKMDSLVHKQKIRVKFSTSLLSLDIIPKNQYTVKLNFQKWENQNNLQVNFRKCQADFFIEFMPFFKEFQPTFRRTKISFFAKSFNEIYPKLQTIAVFPFEVVSISLDPKNDFSFENHFDILKVFYSESTQIKSIIFDDFWSYHRHGIFKINFSKLLDSKFPIFELLDLIHHEEEIIVDFKHFDRSNNYDGLVKFFPKRAHPLHLEISDVSWALNGYLSSFQQLDEISLSFSLNGKKYSGFNISRNLEKSVPQAINSMFVNSPKLKFLKIKVDSTEFCFKIDFPAAKNLIALEIDCDKIYFDVEKFPVENNLVSIKFIGRNKYSKHIIENSEFLEKFEFLTKLVSFYIRFSQITIFKSIDLKINPKILKSIESRKFLKQNKVLKAKLEKKFRKEIIKEIFSKIEPS